MEWNIRANYLYYVVYSDGRFFYTTKPWLEGTNYL